MGTSPPPFYAMLVAPMTAPADALAALVPQWSKSSQQRGGAAVSLDKIISDKPCPAGMANGKASVIEYTFTRTLNGVTTQRHSIARIETAPVAQGSWMFSSTEIAAPEQTFEQDRKAMFTMAISLKVNAAVLQQKSQEQTNAILRQGEINEANLQAQNKQFQQQQQQRFEQGQEAHRQQLAGYAQHNAQWQQDNLAKARHADDVVEQIRGYRTVQDTQTGQQVSVDYSNVDDVVAAWNEHDPGHYVEIPYRDEKDPLQNR
jgi:hypothetical protein